MQEEIITEEKVTQAVTLLDQAKLTEIIDQETCDSAVVIGKQAKDLRKVIVDDYEPHIKTAHKAHKDLLATCKKHTAPLDEVITLLTKNIKSYQFEQKRLREEAEKKAQAEADEAARKEQERLDAEALEAADKGNEEAFEEAVQAKEEVQPENFKPVSAPAPKMQGAHTRENWQHEVVDLPALVKAIAEGKASIKCIMPDKVYLGKIAKADKETAKIPGVVFHDVGTVSFR